VIVGDPAPRGYGMLEGWSRPVTRSILRLEIKTAMRVQKEDDMRTALRQAGAITAISGQRCLRQTLGLAHAIYNSLILLEPEQRARRIELIDTVFGPARRYEHRQGHQ
jgi:hypothetical protein